jgi:trimethylamine--corrinoid protein Co-methyltransferase
MLCKGFTRNFKPLEIISEEQVEDIHRATLEVLEKTGVTFVHEKALKLLQKSGCFIDEDNQRVRFPSWIVEECIRKTPSSFHCKARDPVNNLRIGGNTVYFTNFPGMQLVDIETWEPRPATRQEFYDYVKVLDALENLHWLWGYPLYGFEGIPPVMCIPESVAGKIRNSTKFQITANTKEADIFTIQMAQALDIDIMDAFCISSPLTYYEDQIECAYRCIEAGFPVIIASGNIYGGTAPATIAGATITNNAELLAGLCFIQLISPGSKVMVQDFTFPQNMLTGTPAFGAIGASIHHTIYNQIWRRYNIPKNTASIGSSKNPDFQNGYEKAIPAIIDAVAGSNVICLHGGINGELSAHHLQAIMDDDIAGMVGRYVQGAIVNDATMALDLICEVGPIPGVYLDKAHTREWWKKEQFLPKSVDRLTYPEWKKAGKKSGIDYAKERLEDILTNYKPTPLTDSHEKDIQKILNEARAYYKKKEML